MKNRYKTKFALEYVRCLKCNYVYETITGDFDIEYDAITMAEELHDDNPARRRKCTGQLIIYVKKYFVQEKV